MLAIQKSNIIESMIQSDLLLKMYSERHNFIPPLKIKEILDFSFHEMSNQKQIDESWERGERWKAIKQAVDNRKFVNYKTKKEILQEIKKCNQEIYEYMDKKYDAPNENTAIWYEILIEEQVERKRRLQNRLKYMGTKSSSDFSGSIDKAKQVPISDFIEFNKAGFARCLWHSPDKNPSMHYHAKINKIHCFSCGKNGDSIDCLMKLNKVTLSEAVKILSK